MESEYVLHFLFIFPDHLFRRYSSRQHLDRRTWKQRLTRTRQNWDPVLPSLVKFYLGWKYAPTTCSHSPITVDPPIIPPPPPGDYDFLLEVLDIYTLDTSVTIPCSNKELPIEALVKSGYLGNTPATPSLAISFRTLELFRRLRLRKSSFSVEAFVKVVCDIYSVCFGPWRSSVSIDTTSSQVPYRRRYRSSFADTFETYVIILRLVKGLVDQELGRDVPDWRVKHACPPCTYEECIHV